MQDQVKISIGEEILNSERMLGRWLNAAEYHRDDDELIKELKERQAGLSRRIFMMLLRHKVDGILALGSVTHRMLSAAQDSAAPDA